MTALPALLLRAAVAGLSIFAVGASKPGATAPFQPGTPSSSDKVGPHCAPSDVAFGLSEPWMVFFDLRSAKIRPEAALILKNAAIGYRQFPKCVVVVEGYTDGLEAASHVRQLDARRAAAVVHFLRRHGVTMRVLIKTYGDTRPLVELPEGAAEPQNRRVGFNVIDPANGGP